MIDRGIGRTADNRDSIHSENAQSVRIVVGIPAYNEAVGSGRSIFAILHQVIGVNDRSSDAMATIADLAGAFGVRRDENQGQGTASQTLLTHIQAGMCDSIITSFGRWSIKALRADPTIEEGGVAERLINVLQLIISCREFTK